MNAELDRSLAGYLTALGDDELVLAHRNSEWTGHAPILEEDIAFANLALDELGHASAWYQRVAELLGEDPLRYPDLLVYQRPAGEFRNARLVELPNGDWAFSMLRQYLFDQAEQIRLEALSESRHPGVAQTAAKIRIEEIYHLRHTRAWVLRLGLGTEESHSRMQSALDRLYPAAGQLFTVDPSEDRLAEAGLVPEAGALQESWIERVAEHLRAAGLAVPPGPPTGPVSRHEHTPHLEELIRELQEVARLESEASW